MAERERLNAEINRVRAQLGAVLVTIGDDPLEQEPVPAETTVEAPPPHPASTPERRPAPAPSSAAGSGTRTLSAAARSGATTADTAPQAGPASKQRIAPWQAPPR